jgi:S1-C subfamily serine protease
MDRYSLYAGSGAPPGTFARRLPWREDLHMADRRAFPPLLAAFAALLGLPLQAAHAGSGSPSSDVIADSVVKVSVVASVPDYLSPWQARPEASSGSGAIIAGNRILTNAHVIDNHALIEVQRVGSPLRYTAEVEHQCDPCDLAILSVDDAEFFAGARPLEIGELPRRHQTVQVYGFPIGGETLSITSGIVSRIEVDTYSHSFAQLLLAQVDAAINSGNSGGPAVSGGKIVGVAMQGLDDADNIGDIVPAPVIHHFLEDVRDGRFDGFPALGVSVQALENGALREQLQLEEEDGGALVVGVSRSDSAWGQVEPGDVILKIDDLPVLRNNSVDLGRGLLVDSRFAIQRKQVGDIVVVRLHRDGRTRDEQIALRARDPLIELTGNGPRPSYVIYGGLVFQPLTARYMEVFEDGVPSHLAAFWEDWTLSDAAVLGRENVPATPRTEVVVLTNLLASELTRGYEEFEDRVVHSVDGVPVRNLAHLAQLLDVQAPRFAEITMAQGGTITLRRDEVAHRGPGILARYQVSADRSPDLAVPASPADR